MRIPRFILLVLVVLLAGAALRLALYDYHGLEGDDGFSLAVSRMPLETLIPGLMRLELDIHPPLHFIALKGWTAVAGESLLSLRLMNILADVLTGAFIIRLAGRSIGRRAALAGGVLWVFAPLLIYAAWLVRMYTFEALFITAGAVCCVELLRTGRAAWAVELGVAALAALYTHITGVVAAGAFGAALVVGALMFRRVRPTLAGLIALGIAGVLYLPFALPVLALYRSGRSLGAQVNTSQFGSMAEIPATVVSTLLLHRPSLGLVTLVLLMAASVVLAWKRPRALPLVVLAWTSMLGMMALAAADFYKPRYLAPFLPPMLVLLAGAVVLIPRRALRAVVLIALVVMSAWGIRADLDRTTRDDWVAAARFIEAHERPGDAVIVIPDWGQEAFKFHYRGAAQVAGVFSGISADLDVAPTLESLAQGHGVWLVRYQPEVSDPDNRAGAWFSEQGALATEVFPAGMRVLYYDLTPQLESLPDYARPLDAQFGGVLALRGVWQPVTAGSAGDTRLHPPSNWVHVVLFWEAVQPGATAAPRVRFTSPFAEVYGAALDRAGGTIQKYPIDTWQLGEIYAVAYDLNLNPATPQGTYNIEVMVLDPATGEALPSTGADAGEFWVIAGQFTITE